MPRPEPTTHLPPETVQEIKQFVSRELASAGVRATDVIVRSGQDHDGDPAILVEVAHRPGPHPFDGRAAARTSFSLNTMLRQRGEPRFAYIRHSEQAGA